MQLLLVYVVIIGAVMVFMTSRGRKKQQTQQLTMREALVPGVEARTIGGLVGEVVEVTDEHVILETTPGVRLKFVKTAVAGILPPAIEADAEPEEYEQAADSETEPEDSAAELGSESAEDQDGSAGGETEGLAPAPFATAEAAEAELSKK
ncbi:MAG TPA: preprotein translocase subunit YajC [Actinocrinis sp.]|nr:preprotein translocase subunit YajC [Actinocrinis sp.]